MKGYQRGPALRERAQAATKLDAAISANMEELGYGG